MRSDSSALTSLEGVIVENVNSIGPVDGRLSRDTMPVDIVEVPRESRPTHIPVEGRMSRDTTPLDIVEIPRASRPAHIPGQVAELLDALTRAGCAQRTFKSGWFLLEAGAPAHSMFVVVQGKVQVRLGAKNGAVLCEAGRGGLVGEMSMVDDSPACAFVVAVETTTVMEVPRSRFWALVETSHIFARQLLESLSQRLRENNRAVASSALRNEELRREATRDPLTGVLNRRWLDAQLPLWAAQQQGNDKPFAFALIDVDHFKSFNDRFGHLAGDVVLAAVGSTLRGCVRSSDAIIRYGGEEFAVALPGAPLEPAVAVLQRMQQAVARLKCRAPDGTPLPRVNFSAGVVSVREFEPCALIARADALLYDAKRQGRNRVCGSNAL